MKPEVHREDEAAGPLADSVGVSQTLVGAGVVIVAATALVLLIDEVRTLRRTDVALAPAP